MRIILCLILLFLPTLSSALEYHGENTIYKDTVWQGDILIDGILTIAMGATLEIRPGTHVRFAFIDTNADGIGESEIFAQGHFVARGTADRPIIFTSALSNPTPGSWGALNMMMSEESENLLEHCLVEFGYRGFHAHYSKARLDSSTFRYNQRGAQFQESTVSVNACVFEENFNGLQFRDSKVRIRNSLIKNNHWGIRAVFVELDMAQSCLLGNRTNGLSLRDSTLQLRHNTIENNRRGVYLQRSQGEITQNRIAGNREHGIYLEDSIAGIHNNLIRANGRSGLKVLDSGGTFENNQIEHNIEYSIYNAGEDDFNVGPNWYGPLATKPRLMDGQIRDGFGFLFVADVLLQQPEVNAR